jgi:Patatin-like phospholipase
MSTGKQYEGPPIEEGVALALSGGGFRAMLYHVGALWRLNELGLLNTLDRLTSVSGGALLAGCLAARWSSLRFDDSVAMNLREQVFEDVLRFSRRLIDIPAGLAGFLPLMSAASAASRSYRKHLVGDATLQDLPDRPRFIFDSQNRTWVAGASVLSKTHLSSSRPRWQPRPRFPRFYPRLHSRWPDIRSSALPAPTCIARSS